MQFRLPAVEVCPCGLGVASRPSPKGVRWSSEFLVPIIGNLGDGHFFFLDFRKGNESERRFPVRQ